MEYWKKYVEESGPSQVRIKKHGNMAVDAVVITSKEKILAVDDGSPQQLVDTASIPGVVGEVWGMADFHRGYGIPIGGVVSTDIRNGGVISPGGVGFDINCGVRLCSIDLEPRDLVRRIGGDVKNFGNRLKSRIPASNSGKGGIRNLSTSDMDQIISEGAKGVIELGIGDQKDLKFIEEGGKLDGSSDYISESAVRRGINTLGTIGKGNHFLEMQVVDKIFNEAAAETFGLVEGQMTAMIHTGSRGLGYQVCSENVSELKKKFLQRGDHYYSEDLGISVPNLELVSAPFDSDEGQKYFRAMQSAANYAFANRSAVTHRVSETLRDHMKMDVDMDLIYDVSHNIARIEHHEIGGNQCECCVHRKGATRAFGKDSEFIPEKYEKIGQPVLVPGDMGTASYVLAGPNSGMNKAFGSSCHGAGRKMSRTRARELIDGDSVKKELAERGISIYESSKNCLSEEAPGAYKDIEQVVRNTSDAGLAYPVARLKPFMVIKG